MITTLLLLIDPVEALEEFKEILEDSMSSGNGGSSGGGAFGNMGLPDVKQELVNLLGDTSDPPPGTDEIVAMTKIVTYLESGYDDGSGSNVIFDRIVMDTAPTGKCVVVY